MMKRTTLFAALLGIAMMVLVGKAQANFFSDAWDGATGAVSTVATTVAGTATTVASGVATGYKATSGFLSDSVAALVGSSDKNVSCSSAMRTQLNKVVGKSCNEGTVEAGKRCIGVLTAKKPWSSATNATSCTAVGSSILALCKSQTNHKIDEHMIKVVPIPC
jgi:hypothetical protein